MTTMIKRFDIEPATVQNLFYESVKTMTLNSIQLNSIQRR